MSVERIQIRENVKKSNGSEWNSSERTTETRGVDVLLNMFVTAAVFHLEMSALNAVADTNAVGGCRCRVWLANPEINKKRENVKKSNGSEWDSSERTTETRGVDVLFFMLVTAAVSHLERSALNIEV
tara:strand:+ start:218 stop:598 length:381 start_codon:yes stop_codon:yes gene_type:complete